MFVLAAELFLIVQSNSDPAADKPSETHTEVDTVDTLSSSRAVAVAMEGHLSYKATHHEGKVSMIECH